MYTVYGCKTSTLGSLQKADYLRILSFQGVGVSGSGCWETLVQGVGVYYNIGLL